LTEIGLAESIQDLNDLAQCGSRSIQNSQANKNKNGACHLQIPFLFFI